MTLLFHAHSGLRYLVLLAGLAGIAYLLYGISSKRPFDRWGRRVGSIFTGLLDLQILLGVILVIGGRFFPALIGHIVIMTLAAAIAHATSVVNRRRSTPGYLLPLLGTTLALLAILLGITTLGHKIL